MIYIAIVDDDSLIVSLLKEFLNHQPNTQVLFTANCGEELLTQLKGSRNLPAIVLLDLKMEGMGGIDVLPHLKSRYPEINTIVISSYFKPSFTGFMFKSGVAAFLHKGISPTNLFSIIQTVDEKGYYFSDDQIETLREQVSSKSPAPILDAKDTLTEREIEVLSMIIEQKTAKEIGELLFITQRTVEGHKTNLFAKTGAKNLAGLVIYAIQNKIVKIEDIPMIE